MSTTLFLILKKASFPKWKDQPKAGSSCQVSPISNKRLVILSGGSLSFSKAGFRGEIDTFRKLTENPGGGEQRSNCFAQWCHASMGARQSSPASVWCGWCLQMPAASEEWSCQHYPSPGEGFSPPGLVHFSICAELRVSPWTTMKNRDYFGGIDFDITGYLNVFSLTRVLGCGELIVTHFNIIYSICVYVFGRSTLVNSAT